MGLCWPLLQLPCCYYFMVEDLAEWALPLPCWSQMLLVWVTNGTATEPILHAADVDNEGDVACACGGVVT